MKRNDITALHDKTKAELFKQLETLQKQLATARLQKAVGKLASPAFVTGLRNDIARIKTVMRERELQAA
ncbi:50S ribosomal protein L29 [Candidatus Woesebacteria bacterium]|nr:50S ribosomal protein L29 [Candidatus Woesebacteria bacterium]